MADLSRTEARITKQDRPLDRRGGILPQRRNTEAPQRQIFADMRSASRGDVGGAEALARLFGRAEDAAQEFKAYTDAKFQQDARKDSAAGAADEALGRVDVERMERSKAYREAVTDGRTRASLYGLVREVEEGARAIIEKQDSPDPAEREAELEEYLDQQFRSFALNEDGTVKDFGSPETRIWLANEIRRSRLSLTEGGFREIEKRINTQSIDTAVAIIQNKARAGLSVDVEEAMATLPPTADRKAAKTAIIDGVKELAAELEESDPERAKALLLGLLNSQRGPTAAALEDDGAVPEEAPAEPAAAQPAVPLFEGFGTTRVSGKIGEARSGGRSHNGEDFPLPIGTQLRAPIGATVQKVFTNKQGGRQVILKLDNGDTLGVAHMSTQSVREGQRVEAGEVFGLSGNTGVSSGPHAHVTVRRGGKEPASPSEYLASLQQSATDTDGAPMAPKVPGEADFGLGEAPLQMGGAYSLNPDERLQVREALNALSKRAEVRAEQNKAKAQDELAGTFLDRLNGIGAYPTRKEILDARRNELIDARQATALIGQIEQDENKALAAEDRALARAERAERVAERDEMRRAEKLTERFMGPVYSGKVSTTEAAKRLLDLAATIDDPDVRRSVVGSVRSELGAVENLRQNTPAFRSASEKLDRLEQQILDQLPAQLRGNRGAFPGGRRRAEQLVKNRVNELRTRLGRAATTGEDLTAFDKSLESETKAWVGSTFQGYLPPAR